VTRVVGDRSLPLIFADFARQAGLTVECDPHQWVQERRQKTAEEIQHLRQAQHVTEEAVQMACELIAHAQVRSDGVLLHQGQPLTSQRVRAAVDHWLLDSVFDLTSAKVR
jgi:Xaa-Pro aminopeptidase